MDPPSAGCKGNRKRHSEPGPGDAARADSLGTTSPNSGTDHIDRRAAVARIGSSGDTAPIVCSVRRERHAVVERVDSLRDTAQSPVLRLSIVMQSQLE